MAMQFGGADYSSREIDLLIRIVKTDSDQLVTFQEFISIVKEDFGSNIEAVFKGWFIKNYKDSSNLPLIN